MATKSGQTSFMAVVRKFVVGGIENFFYWYGQNIAKRPWRFISSCLFLVFLCSLGFLRFRIEKNPLKLWVPPDSDYLRDTDWIMDTFKEGFRNQYLLIKAPNVLEPEVLLELERIRKNIIQMTVKNETYEDACFRIPAIKPGSIGLMDLLGRRRKRSFFFFGQDDGAQLGGLQFDPSLYLSSSSYCRIVNKLPKVCLEFNLAQLWGNDETVIKNLSLNDVILALNTTSVSPVTGHPVVYRELLGGIDRDENGRIVSARSILAIWMTHVNFSQVNMDENGNMAGTSDWATKPILDWELGYLDLLESETQAHDGSNVTLYYEAGRSFADISGKSMFQDVGKLFIGNLIMFVFIQLVLPTKFNIVEIKFWLGVVGLMVVLLSFITTIGICSLLGIPYGPVHTSLPFLLLGLGVDDMFVITACWHNLLPSEQKLPLELKIATTMKHAGLSITITSVTDFIAFLVGSFTILPSLQSFCLYTGIGILAMFFFQSTIFVAFLTLDAKRIENSGNFLLWWIKHPSYKKPVINPESYQSRIFGTIYEKVILTCPGKIFVLLLTAGLAGVAIKGDLHLTQRFEPEWFLPSDSHMLKFVNQRKMFYPDLGLDGAIFIGKGNYGKEFQKIHSLALSFKSEEHILKIVDSWTPGFIQYCLKSKGIDILNDNTTDDDFQQLLSNYLWSPGGARFQKNFQFSKQLLCGEPAPSVEISSIDIIFRRFSGPEEYLPAMNQLKAIVADANLPHATVWAKIFGNWVTDEVIERELYRNLAMAMGCVMICTAILIIDLQVCFWIFMCVFLTLIDVAGYMYFWGLYIDIASFIALVLAVGLCVDFAAHIGHTFLRLTGTRQERAINTVKFIGTATCNGAFSTLLSLVLLGFSDAYIFTTFFRIFFLVVIFGIFHGVVFLPVVLSIMGPPSYNESTSHSPIPRQLSNLKFEKNHEEESLNGEVSQSVTETSVT